MSLYEYRAILVRWIDADSVVLDLDLGLRTWRRGEHFRLLGINAPDKQPAKKQATGIANQLVPAGSTVVARTVKDEDDRYGRWLATLWHEDPQQSINDKLVHWNAAVYWDGTGTRPEAETK
jgi:micrococcal nuclease